MADAQNRVKRYLYTTIFGTDTPHGKAFDIALIVLILASMVVLMLESIASFHAKWSNWLYWIEWGFTGIFTIEYILRLYCSPRPSAYARSFYGVVDLLAILPTYIAIFVPGTTYLMVVRLLRVLRIFRVLRLMRFLEDSNILLRSMMLSSRKVMIFFFSVAILVTVFGALMYVIEGPENGFTSIPYAIYWAIVTLTTVVRPWRHSPC